MADDDEDDLKTREPVAGCSKWFIHKDNPHNREEAVSPVSRRQPRRSSSQLSQICPEEQVREERFFDVDRLDCLRALEQKSRPHAVPASTTFFSLQDLLKDSDVTLEPIHTYSDPEVEEPDQPLSIIEIIRRDFCDSPTYIEDDVSADVESPWFRFRGKKIKTYGRKQAKTTVLDVAGGSGTDREDNDDIMSCCSDLSVQEDYVTQVPTTSHRAFDVNSSQLICENLLNLSAFFSQNNANKSINLPDKQESSRANCTIEEIKDCQNDDITDILEEIGYLIDKAEQSDKNCDNITTDEAEVSLFHDKTQAQEKENPRKADLTKDASEAFLFREEKPKEEKLEVKGRPEDDNASHEQHSKDMEIALLEDIPLTEWQLLDAEISASNNEDMVPKDSGQKKETRIAVATMEPFGFRTASNKTVELSEEMRRKAAMLMADLETSTMDQPVEEVSGFDAASSKPMDVTEQMQKAAIKQKDDLETPKENNTAAYCEFLDDIPLSEWQPIDIPDGNEAKKELHASSQLDLIPLSEWQPLDIPEAVTSNQVKALIEPRGRACDRPKNRNPPQSNTSNTIEFRTASNRVMALTKEMQRKAAVLMADLEVGLELQGIQPEAEPDNGEEMCPQVVATTSKGVQQEDLGFRTASNKTMKLSDEMWRKAASLMADLESGLDAAKMPQINDPPKNEQNCCRETGDETGFRTASNKVVKLTEEMRRKAASLMSDIESGLNAEKMPLGNDPRKDAKNCSQVIGEDTGSRTASNKVVKLNKETREKAVALADLEAGTSNQSVHQLETPENFNKPSTCKPVTRPRTRSIERKVILPSEEIDGVKPLEPEHNQETKNSSPDVTPRCTQELQASLSQLTERSPLDRATKSSIITRRNLLSLNKRRKQKRDVENTVSDAADTPIRRFAPMAASTSTPMPILKDNSAKGDDKSVKERSFSQDSPSGHGQRMRKRKSEDALSPIYAPTTKTRRLGLSRIRNKSTNEI